MAKYAFLFTRLNKAKENKIYVADVFSLDVVGQGDVDCRHGKIANVYHVPDIGANILFVAQLKQTCNIVEFWLDQFYVHDLKKGKLIFTSRLLDLMDNLYKICDMSRRDTEMTSLVYHTNKRIRIWHE